MSEEKKLNGTVIVTYRCNARCSMCNRYKAPSKPEEEISIETIKKLPKMYFTNITGGEPFIRTDLKDIVRELYKKSDRIVISTNGFFTDRIVDLCKEFPQIGIRISIEGLEQTNNEIRGLQNGYQRGYGTLKKLREMGMKDVGFGMTVQDKNYAKFHRRLNLKCPVTYTEKLNWLKLYDRKMKYHEIVDKYEAKNYVAQILGDRYIIPTYGVWERFEDIDFSTLPQKFAIKTTHDSCHYALVHNKNEMNI